MIEVNLVTSRADVRKSRGRTIAVCCSIATSTVFLGWYFLLINAIESTASIESSLQQKSDQLIHIRSLIALNREKQLELKGKATALEKLLKDRNNPVLIMNAVTDSLPTKRRLSLTNLSQVKQRLCLSGKALDFATIVDFVSGLSASALFKSVELQQWRTREGILYFEILCFLKD